MSQQQTFIEDVDISYSDLEKEGFSQSFINDYTALKRMFEPLFGEEPDPNGVFTANRSRLYFDTLTQSMWVNESYGARTGWVKYI